MFDHDKINFKVEKFSLYSSVSPLGISHHKVPSDIGVGLRRVDTQEPYQSEQNMGKQWYDGSVQIILFQHSCQW